MPLEIIESHSLLPDLIRNGGVVIDCGANLGAFSKVMVERFKARVFAFEASPAVFAGLPALPGLTTRNVAVCGQDGPVKLAINDDITRTASAFRLSNRFRWLRSRAAHCRAYFLNLGWPKRLRC